MAGFSPPEDAVQLIVNHERVVTANAGRHVLGLVIDGVESYYSPHDFLVALLKSLGVNTEVVK